MSAAHGMLGRHVYFDANALIACVEHPSSGGDFFDGLMADVASGDTLATTSELTIAEVLVKPMLRKAHGLTRRYEELLGPGGGIRAAPVDRAVLRRAAQICGESRLDLPDAIHVATAEIAGCDIFLSNDRDIRLPAEMELRRLDLAAARGEMR